VYARTLVFTTYDEVLKNIFLSNTHMSYTTENQTTENRTNLKTHKTHTTTHNNIYTHPTNIHKP